jgi:hypothetical protein
VNENFDLQTRPLAIASKQGSIYLYLWSFRISMSHKLSKTRVAAGAAPRPEQPGDEGGQERQVQPKVAGVQPREPLEDGLLKSR